MRGTVAYSFHENLRFQNVGYYKLLFPFLELNPEILEGQASQIFDDQSNFSSESENDHDDITSDLEEDNADPAGLTEVTPGNSYSLHLRRLFRLAESFTVFPYQNCESVINRRLRKRWRTSFHAMHDRNMPPSNA